MSRKLCSLVISAVCLSTHGVFATDEDANKSPKNRTSFESRILTLTDVVLQKHIDPPTRQQMILAGTKALYQADKRQIPKGLSQRVSDLAKPEQFEEFLKDIQTEFGALRNTEVILTQGLLSSLPCGAHLVDAETNMVQGQLAANRYVGIGIALTMNKKENFPAIPTVIYNGPAWRAGVKSGDMILKVNGQTMQSKNLVHAVQHLRGEEGSEVTIEVRQPGSQKSRKLKMTRGRVFIPTVEGTRKISEGEWQYKLGSADDIAYVRIKNIGSSTLHELRQVEAKLRDQNMKGIILDLRGGGSVLHDTIMVADSLLDGGVIGQIQSLDSLKKHEARPGALFQNIPMVVLVGKQTSPGSVFLTAALQDNHRAIVIGEPTSGQTYVRSNVPLPYRHDHILMATALMQRGDGTTLLVPRFRSPRLPKINVGKTTQPIKRPGFIMPDHSVVPRQRAVNRSKGSTNSPILAKATEVLRSMQSQIPSQSKDKQNPGS